MLRHLLTYVPIYALTSVITLLILYLTLMPKPLPDMDIPLFEGIDKVVHFLMMYGLTGTLAFDTLRLKRYAATFKAPAVTVIAITVGTIAFGGAIELIQRHMEMGRGCEIFDFAADTAGSLLAMVTIFFLWPTIARWYHKPSGLD